MYVQRLVEKRLQELERVEEGNNKHIEYLKEELKAAHNFSKEIQTEKDMLTTFKKNN